MDWTTDAGTLDWEQAGATDSEQNEGSTNEWESQYRKLQADYTKKSQELADIKKQQETWWSITNDKIPNPDEEQLLGWMKKQWFVRHNDLEKQNEQQKFEIWFNQLLQENPDLKQFEWAIRAVQKVEGGSFEEVAIRHWFTSWDKLEKARASRNKMVWNDNSEKQQEKRLTDMTPDEYEAWKKKNGVWYSAWLVGSWSI